jgi:hypothetical protein
MRTGQAVLRLPYPQCEFDRYKKRLLPGEINGQTYRWMHTTEEKVFEDRANSRRHWKLLRRFTADLKRKQAEYSASYVLGDTEAEAHIAWVLR